MQEFRTAEFDVQQAPVARTHIAKAREQLHNTQDFLEQADEDLSPEVMQEARRKISETRLKLDEDEAQLSRLEAQLAEEVATQESLIQKHNSLVDHVNTLNDEVKTAVEISEERIEGGCSRGG